MGSCAKGSGLLYLRSEIKKRGDLFANSFHDNLNSEEKDAYDKALAFTWVSIEIVGSLFEKAALALFPEDGEIAFRKFGKESMKHDIKGIYRVAMHFTSVNYLIEQVARTWGMYFNAGRASMEKIDDNILALILKEFPDLPKVHQETIAGTLEAIMEMVNKKNSKVTYSLEGNVHKWIVAW
jgi:hypothetical protein